MVMIPLGDNDWESASENISRLRLRNMYLTENPASEDGLSRVSRPTLAEEVVIGDGPIAGAWRQANTLDGDWLVVSGEELYRYDGTTPTLIDDLPGDGRCQFAGTADRVIIVRDGVAYSTDGTTVVEVVMPDDVPGYDPLPAPVGSVATINSYFLLSVLDSQRFYWIEPGEVDPDPLSFASAERIPDSIESIAITSDEVWFIGKSGPEVWSPAADVDAPFQRVSGRVYNEGCAARDSVVSVTRDGLPALVWVTDTRSVVLAQGQPSTVSTESVEELLKTATDLRAWGFRHNRHDFYVLTTATFTLALDLKTMKWSRWDSYLQSNWAAHLGLQDGPTVYAGSSETGQIWRLEEGDSDAGDPVIREVSGLVPHSSSLPISCAKVTVKVNVGWAPEYDYEPVLEMRWSDDQGWTWSDYVQIGLGETGVYNKETYVTSLGLITNPGRHFEFRFSDIARFRLDYASINE